MFNVSFGVADSCALGNGQYYQAIAGQPSKYKWILSPEIYYEMPCSVGTVFSIQKCQCIAATQPATTQPATPAAPGNAFPESTLSKISLSQITSSDIFFHLENH